MNRTQSLKYVLATCFFGLALLFMASVTAHAQYYGPRNVWQNQNDHQRWEHSIYGRPHWLKHHQRQERHQLKDMLYNRHGYNSYNDGGYYNSYPNYGNYGYNPGYYGNYGNYGRGYYGIPGYYNNRYYGPHNDSRHAFKRGLHHLLGGH